MRGTAFLIERAERIASYSGLAVAAVGLIVLFGWVFDILVLKTVSGPITMKTNASIGLIGGGLALWLGASGRAPAAAAAAAWLTGAIGALTLIQHVSGWDLGIDQLLFTEPAGAAATASPNRMGPHASTSFMLAALALLALRRPPPRGISASQVIAFAGAAFALVALIGYVYGAIELYGLARYTGIALHTAIMLFVLHVGILAATARGGAMATFVDDGAAGTLLRRLAVPVVALPLLLGYLFMRAMDASVVDRGLGASLFAVATIVILLAVLWRTAAVIRAADQARQRAFEAAENASRLKDQFIAVLSHELRTPLNVMLGRLRSIEGDADPETRIRAAGVIARNGQLLARLVEDLLDLSRATAGQFEIATASVDLNALVATTIEASAGEASRRGVRVTASLDEKAGVVAVDLHRMQQVLANLLSNALKFTPEGGQVYVETARRGDRVAIVVRDTGVGFDPEFAPHLFEPFRQADQSFRREYGGLGLGLSIARHLVTLHGGTIEAVSPGIGQGATFTIELPATPDPSPAAQPGPAGRTALAGGV